MSFTIDLLPYTITLPGEYVLTSNLESSSNGINIKASNVTIDLNGYKITGSESPKNNFYGISAFNCDNISISNGNIVGFQYGIYLSDLVDHADTAEKLSGGGHLVENVNISDSTFRGIRIEGQNNVVKNNTICNIGGATLNENSYGMGIESFGLNATISSNTIQEIRGSGMNDLGEGVGISVTRYGDGTIISKNSISNLAAEVDGNYSEWAAPSRSSWAIWVGGDGSSNIVVDGNNIDNFIYGITFKRTVAGEFLNNEVTNAVVPYYRPFDPNGIRVIDSGNNTSDVLPTDLPWGRYTPGQIESVEAIYLSPLYRSNEYLFYPFHNPSNLDETVTGQLGRLTLVDYWAAPSAVRIDLIQGVVTGGGGNDTLVNILGAQGSKFDDTITGNDFANLLCGSTGNDTVYGGAGNDYIIGDDVTAGSTGNDILYGGLGADILDGGAGLDYAGYNDASYAGLTASLITPTINSGVATGDTYTGIEGLILTNNNDIGYGDNNANYLYGMGGNDSLYGGNGNDRLYGGDGNDSLYGGLGADILDGGSGLDYARYNDASYAGLTASLITPTINSGVAIGDTYTGIEGLILTNNNDIGYGDNNANYLYGMGGNDSLYGGNGNDRLYGGDGNDSLYGGLGADILDGGSGDALLFGGASADIFIFSSAHENDIISDFEGGYGIGDRIDFHGTFSTFDDVISHCSQVGDNVVITYEVGCSVTINNFYLGNFGADDVII